MPQLIFKNVSADNFAKAAKPITERLSSIIDIPKDHIVAEYSPVSFMRGGAADEHTAMVWVSWKKRSPELQRTVAELISEELHKLGYDPVEVVYDNLDMNDFYEFKS